MSIRELHNKAMALSQMAKLSLAANDYDKSREYYAEAAIVEGQVVSYYESKASLLKTKMVLYRSAAFLHLKAGMVEEAYAYITKGLAIATDSRIKEQLYDALEEFLRLRSKDEKAAHFDYNYRSQLKARSVEYVIEAASWKYAKAIPTSSAADFLHNIERSIKAFAAAEYRMSFNEGAAPDAKELALVKTEMVPLIASAGNGSLKLMIGNNFLPDPLEKKELSEVRDALVEKYNEEILSNKFDENSIKSLVGKYTAEERKEILLPVLKIRSGRSDYRVAYVDRTSSKKQILPRVKPAVRRRVIAAPTPNDEVQRFIEQRLVLKRVSSEGGVRTEQIQMSQFSTYSFPHSLSSLQLPNFGEVLLAQPVVIHVDFEANDGFTLSIDDLSLEAGHAEFDQAIESLMLRLEQLIRHLRDGERNQSLTAEEAQWMIFLRDRIGDLYSLRS